MSELTSVLCFLENSKKGKLKYDRHWANSPESVHQLLQDLSLGIQEIELDKPKRSSTSRKHDIKVLTTRADDEALGHQELQDEVTLTTLAGAPAAHESGGEAARRMTSWQLSLGKTGSGGGVMYSEPVDELDYSNLSPLDHSTHSNSSDESLSEDQFSTYRHRPVDLSTNRSSSRIESFLAGADDSRYFGIEPVKINVNRRAEINISGGVEQLMRQYDSPRFIKVVEMNSDSGVGNRNRLSDAKNTSKNENSNANKSVFEYKEGYLEKVAKTPLSEDLVTLRMDSIRHLVQLDVQTSQEEAEDPAPHQEESDEQALKESQALDLELSKRRELIRIEVEKERTELLRKCERTSQRLAEEAELRYRTEINEYRREQHVHHQKTIKEREQDRKEAELHIAASIEADKLRREETRQLLQLCKEQEDKIRKEQEQESLIKTQQARFEQLMPSLKKNIMSLLELWSTVENKALFCAASTEAATNIHTDFSTAIDTIKAKIKTGSAVDEDWDNLTSLEARIERGVRILKEDIERINTEAEAKRLREEEEKKKVEAETAAAAVAAAKASVPTEQAAVTSSNTAIPPANIVAPNEPQAKASPPVSAEQFYREVLAFKAKYVEDVVFTDQEKKIKSELTLGISTALNAISSQTKEHLNDKLAKLFLLLSGKPVTMKDIQICAGQHRFGVKYCTALLAKKIVRQGEDVVSSKAEAAFPIAGVALSLWDKFPDFGKLLQAYFFEFCPLLAPYYPAKQPGQSEKDFFVSLGYKYEKEVMEPQDKYLKRMTGLACLYSALAVVAKPQGAGTIHPMGPCSIWKYLAVLINTPPLPDVTATILFVVLETTGNLMLTKYNDQFLKLIAVIKANFLPVLESVKTDGGPTSRLELLLNKTLSQRQVEKPRGILAPGFIKNLVL
eukprot:TRINITY_DN1182_c0_g1_i4.p1 TRINITY_DN1182_c0_g1~~TRINITY_DN1182_c0_g1_i4.p1  ORF type:complete len:904 (-),score=267.21 TRINITY_DN1182_c0_g1_i4:84-2795(-)